MTRLDIRRIITKYINQEATPEEMTILYEWVKKGNNQEVFKKLVQADFLINYQNRSWETEEAFKQFLETIKEKESRKVRTLYMGRQVLKYAAAIVILVASAAYFILQKNSPSVLEPRLDSDQITLQLDNGEIISFDPDSDATVKSKSGKTVVSLVKGVLSQNAEADTKGKVKKNVLRVPFGKSLSLTLQDGSVVRLNSGSTLTYPSSFVGMDKREVQLEGEAFFEVAKNPGQPFIVGTKNMYTQVFGTVFNISAYDEDNISEVVLVEGSVGIGSTEHTVAGSLQMLKPSQRASNKEGSGDRFVIEDVDVTPYISWTQGVLSFENEEMSEIIKRLQRQFNIKIVNKHEKLGERRFTGMFDEEDLDRILRTIQAHTHFSYSKEGNTITITEPEKQ
ncbi:FecR family protein [Flagellimonas taeanensis]|uniref:FecR family protein n=1 Tax=Flagellimonas taeanensis TaxID=1005926 RepID=A0A1M6WWM8_9FLAO|nr:FecR domain-containing protein [Allomuricauda taeanensis]SFB99865.1 FecR family protein [Allomuricauda taeanensis]SHK97969.1 FecR family protein [Allomuricauda taeanensis]